MDTPSFTELASLEPALDDAARRELAASLAALRAPGGLVVRAADVMGATLGRAGDALVRKLSPKAGPLALTEIADAALRRAYGIAILGIEVPLTRLGPPLAAASGIAGGLAGPLGFLPDASFTTLLIMRAIAQAAREQGEDLRSDSGRAACVQVFSLRGADDGGYFAARLMLQSTSARALLSQVAARWGAVLGEKFAAQAVPVAGALAGAALNTAFLAHYRRVARAHFTIRRLERQFGADAVRATAPVLDASFNGA